MKTLLLVAIIAIPMTSFADVIRFHCKSADLVIHKFDASGIISEDDSNNVEGILTISTEKAGAAQSAQTFENVKVKGTVQHFKAGEFTVFAFDQVKLVTNEPYLKHLSLLLNFETKIASRVLSIDNFNYRSDCKILTE
ncbi:MAG: hypothetical protein K2Q18_02175 [Bdellovibrionales bacterium]|nr:hypothetical protein [Bdellovibrionales bacterium]